ncbi:MAG: VWA domain-containing protein [Chloroflexi bacterium]|nr:VWA domain-containing protein [Chloroflexota bacterium]
MPDVYNFDGCTITVTKAANVPTSEVAYADIVLLLDVTLSLETFDLGHRKEAANNFLDAFSPGNADGRVRIGVVRFRGSAASVVDMTDVDYWGTKWAEAAYLAGLFSGCGEEDGKPLFCPGGGK